MSIAFAKYSGCGNDFILIDNRTSCIDTHSLSKVIHKLCHRQLGIGADGIIFLENSSSADFRMRIFNSDGSEPEMCGNGIRCLGRFIRDLGIQGNSFLIQTMLTHLRVKLLDDLVSVNMTPPSEIQDIPALEFDGIFYSIYFLDTGVPHVVIFVEDIENDELFFMAPKIRFHPYFKPRGTNVNFVKISSSNSLVIRTYERGVESETLACGTGCTAAAFASAYVHHLKSPIAVQTRSKEILYISFDQANPRSKELVMTGPAKKIYQGQFPRNLFGF